MKQQLTNGVLFKYRKCDAKGFSILRRREFWFSTADKFNDPFEAETSFPDVMKAVWAHKRTSEETKRKFELALTDSISTIGVCSFSRARKNQLMWSHYADEHKGFCIGFKEDALKIADPKLIEIDVIYQSQYPFKGIVKRINNFERHPSENSLHKIAGEILYSILRTKYSGWKYERERRLIRLDAGAMKFDPEAVNSIAFGLRMSDENKNKLFKLLTGPKWEHVQWYQAEKSTEKYSLNFERIK